MTDTEQVPVGVDANTPSVARIYDYYLGGKDNFASDRAAGDQMIQVVPESREAARANRAFLGRAVRHLAASGITQFLDLGAGLPTQENVHQVALAANPDAQIVYVDNDTIVLIHARALLADNPNTTVLEGDLNDPKAIIEAATAHLDLTKPVAVILAAILHFIPDTDETYRIVDDLRARLAPGSALLISHAYAGDYDPDVVQEGESEYGKTATGSITARKLAEITRYAEGLTLIEPGIAPADAWRPEDGEVAIDLVKPSILCMVGTVE